jgi:hypothetical protein
MSLFVGGKRNRRHRKGTKHHVRSKHHKRRGTRRGTRRRIRRRTRRRSVSRRKRSRKTYRGGSGYKSNTWLSSVGNPVGFSWSGDPNKWPNAGSGCGITQSNHYKNNTKVFDTPVNTSVNTSLTGGRRRKKSRRSRMVGGARSNPLMGTELKLAYRSLINTPQQMIKTWKGLPIPANLYASPTNQPIGKQSDNMHAMGSEIDTFKEEATRGVAQGGGNE